MTLETLPDDNKGELKHIKSLDYFGIQFNCIKKPSLFSACLDNLLKLLTNYW